MKILVCGNGPQLPQQLKGVDLTDYDKVVRVNMWEPIEGYDNRCDAWVCYPLHHIGQDEELCDLMPWTELTDEIWLAHHWALINFLEVFGKPPGFALSRVKFKELMYVTTPHAPQTGTFAIHMAMQLSDVVHVAGFDFYESHVKYYYDPTTTRMCGEMHDPQKDKQWVLKQVKKGAVTIL